MQNLTLLVLLFLFWLINSGIFHGFLMFCGIISVIATFLIYKFLIKITENHFQENFDIFDKSSSPMKMIVFIIKSFFEIIKSSLSLIKNIILNKKIDSRFVNLKIENEALNPLLMLIAHSITITPGSISIHQKSEHEIVVHCLYSDIANEVQSLESDNFPK